MPYIYKITNQINQKSYIGKTTLLNPLERWRQHKAESNKERSKHRALYRAFNKYGVENFIFEIIEEISAEELNQREQYYIQQYNTFHNGYNETLGGDGISYLELPEQEICKFYLQTLSLKETSEHFGYDKETIKKILYKYNIETLSGQEVAKIRQGVAVVQIDKNTDEILAIYPTIREADRAVGGCQHIGSVCRGKRKTAAGYKWKYISELI